MKLLPGLNLDTLTVLGCKGEDVCYESLNWLIRYSDGWKELRFLSHSSAFLGYKDNMLYFGPSYPMYNKYLRQPQPADWQKVLEERDGADSHPSIVIYRSMDTTTPCAILDPTKRSTFVQEFAAGQTAKTYSKTEDPLLMRDDERSKEVLVVVKRGAGADYATKVQSAYLEDGDIREDHDDKTWKEIKTEQDAKFTDDDDECGGVADLSEPALVDSYRHVDEYTWPPYHFQGQRDG